MSVPREPDAFSPGRSVRKVFVRRTSGRLSKIRSTVRVVLCALGSFDTAVVDRPDDSHLKAGSANLCEHVRLRRSKFSRSSARIVVPSALYAVVSSISISSMKEFGAIFWMCRCGQLRGSSALQGVAP
jgi:hypothetical protein